MVQPCRHRTGRIAKGFTLIELLVVIAIIAILTAILLPVFATVRENARASTSLSNMHQISTALAQFKLDQHTYPAVLFGYVAYMYNAATGPTTMVAPMDQAYDQAEAAGVAYEYFPGLYPEYIKDYKVFTDPNNTADPTSASAVAPENINVLCPSNDPSVDCVAGVDDGKLKSVSKPFYTADAYDINPQITDVGTNTISTGTGTAYVPRYQSSWTNINGTLDCTGTTGTFCGANGEDLYTHQLRWQNPPASTYVTSTTYHVPQSGKVLVLWEDGSAKKVATADFLSTNSGYDATTVAVSGTGTASPAKFWEIDPTIAP